LSILLGGIGADRFYAGRIGLGIVKLLSMFVGIGTIWWLIDIFLALMGLQKDSNGDFITRGTSSGGCLGKLVVLLIILGILGGGFYFARNLIEPAVSKLTGLIKTIQTTVTGTAEATATVTADSLNFRAGPSTDHNIIKTLKKGDAVTVTGKIENGWAPVKHGNNTGWVSAELIGLVAATASSSSSSASSSSLDELVGVWEGSYLAGQGETGLTLTVFKDGSNYRATFEFYNLSGRTNAAEGSYRMNVSTERGRYLLKGYEWIKQPGGYSYLNLDGTINGNNFSGNAIGSPNLTFKLVRQP
jgi:uncharacterized protein YraI